MRIPMSKPKHLESLLKHLYTTLPNIVVVCIIVTLVFSTAFPEILQVVDITTDEFFLRLVFCDILYHALWFELRWWFFIVVQLLRR